MPMRTFLKVASRLFGKFAFRLWPPAADVFRREPPGSGKTHSLVQLSLRAFHSTLSRLASTAPRKGTGQNGGLAESNGADTERTDCAILRRFGSVVKVAAARNEDCGVQDSGRERPESPGSSLYDSRTTLLHHFLHRLGRGAPYSRCILRPVRWRLCGVVQITQRGISVVPEASLSELASGLVTMIRDIAV